MILCSIVYLLTLDVLQKMQYLFWMNLIVRILFQSLQKNVSVVLVKKSNKKIL